MTTIKADPYLWPYNGDLRPDNTALIIIDMQRGMLEPAAGERNNPDAPERLTALLHAWRQARAPIVHVRHISRATTTLFAPGRPSVEFQPSVA